MLFGLFENKRSLQLHGDSQYSTLNVPSNAAYGVQVIHVCLIQKDAFVLDPDCGYTGSVDHQIPSEPVQES